jgi:hypothetical protein
MGDTLAGIIERGGVTTLMSCGSSRPVKEDNGWVSIYSLERCEVLCRG